MPERAADAGTGPATGRASGANMAPSVKPSALSTPTSWVCSRTAISIVFTQASRIAISTPPPIEPTKKRHVADHRDELRLELGLGRRLDALRSVLEQRLDVAPSPPAGRRRAPCAGRPSPIPGVTPLPCLERLLEVVPVEEHRAVVDARRASSGRCRRRRTPRARRCRRGAGRCAPISGMRSPTFQPNCFASAFADRCRPCGWPRKASLRAPRRRRSRGRGRTASSASTANCAKKLPGSW